MPENCNPKECPLSHKIETLESRINELEKTNAVQNVQYDAIMKMLENMDKKNDRQAEQIEEMRRTIAKQAQILDELNERGKNNKARLDALEQKPAKRWNDMVDKLIAGLVGGLATSLLAGILYLLSVAGK